MTTTEKQTIALTDIKMLQAKLEAETSVSKIAQLKTAIEMELAMNAQRNL